MTSKEAIERIKNDDYSKRFSKNKLLGIIKKDLERLELLDILITNEVNIEMFNIVFIEFENDYDYYYYNYIKYSKYKMEKNEFNLLVEYLKKIEEE